MTHLRWTPAMRLGIDSMDQAHQRLLLALARLESGPDSALPLGLATLIASMEHNFRAEEQLMAAIDYPELARHRLQHRTIIEALRQAAPAAQDRDMAASPTAAPTAAREIIALMPHWFLFHLTNMDMALSVAAKLADGWTPTRSDISHAH